MCQQRLLGREEEDLKHRQDLAEEKGWAGQPANVPEWVNVFEM